MSSQNQATSETVPLLGDSRPAGQSSRSLPRVRFRFTPEILLIPVALATRLAALMPSTTILELVRQAACRFWNISHGNPVTLPAGGPIPPELCDAPEVERYFATIITILGAIEGVLVMAGCGIISRISSHYGRKPALLLVLIVGIMGSCLIAGSQYTPSWLAVWVFLVGILSGMFSSTSIYGYLVNMYIVDVCMPEDRTTALSKIGGWGALGTCISFALGGSITTKTGNPLIVFYMAAAILVATFTYVISVLPESFPEEKRNALSLMRPEPSVERLSTAPLYIFKPLKMFIPTRKLDGTRNWRLVWCAVHTFVFVVANAYSPAAWLILFTSKYHLTPADTGLFLTIIAVSGTIVMMLILPALVHLLRPYYSRRIIRSLPTEEDTGNGEEPELETSDRLDVHLAFVACVVAAIFALSAAASRTSQALILSGICYGFGSIHIPAIRSLVAGSVSPLKQGEALAAIEIVSNAGGALSPVIMGSIFTATINTTPLLLFYIHLVGPPNARICLALR
ncbi:MFS general substrate transporter [Butyriboletus roseoflavus]|nr:MFS general substrate transporter [Butyriboletus roseoflavus]